MCGRGVWCTFRKLLPHGCPEQAPVSRPAGHCGSLRHLQTPPPIIFTPSPRWMTPPPGAEEVELRACAVEAGERIVARAAAAALRCMDVGRAVLPAAWLGPPVRRKGGQSLSGSSMGGGSGGVDSFPAKTSIQTTPSCSCRGQFQGRHFPSLMEFFLACAIGGSTPHQAFVYSLVVVYSSDTPFSPSPGWQKHSPMETMPSGSVERRVASGPCNC